MTWRIATRRQSTALFAVVLAAMTLNAQDRAAEIAARDKRLAEAKARLAAEISNGGVEGRFFERIPGSYVFAPKPTDLPQASVVNNDAVSTFAVGPLLRVGGKLNEKGQLTITAVRLVQPRVVESGPGVQPGPRRAPPKEVVQAAAAVRKTLEGALEPGAMSVTGRTLDDSSATTKITRENLNRIRDQYNAARAENPPDRQKITAIVEEWARLRALVVSFFPDSQEAKAFYGPLDNYDPWRYDRIFRQSRSVVAIGESTATAPPSRCSGILIAADLVLTAAHCFRDVDGPEDLEVWFDYARTPDGAVPAFKRRKVVTLVAPSPKRLADIIEGTFDASLLDYAILQFEAPAGEPLVPPTAEPQCLRTRPLRRSDPVYVVGYPRGDPIMVHDSARVYLPYRVRTGDEFDFLRLDVDADMLSAPDRLERMQEFDRSYATIRQEGVFQYRFFHHVQDGEQPRMGIVADTFKGNSGGPVFDREGTQCVVGILVAGAPDTGERLTVSWKTHERVLPISAILEDAERHSPGITKRLRVE
jgi:V8-like Glu-specific endopeptidase